MFWCMFQGDEKRCAQVAVESIITWGEAAGVADLPQDLARVIAADVTYRLRQTLSVSMLLYFISCVVDVSQMCDVVKN